MQLSTMELTVPSFVHMSDILGTEDEILKLLEHYFAARIIVRGNCIKLEGDSIELDELSRLFSELIRLSQQDNRPSAGMIEQMISSSRRTSFTPAHLTDEILFNHKGKAIRPKTAGQKLYTEAIKHNSISFGLGPAGTGKTYLAIAMALAALKTGEVSRIILSRPVVEAGESLGFLPGSLEEKVDPYVRPLYDALYDMCDADKVQSYLERGIIEIAPLAFMRGRTLNDAFVILDEAQNATAEQLKMFLTRLGFNSKFVITGDLSQSDLQSKRSGLLDIESILGRLDDIAFIKLGKQDVIRHSLVAKIVQAYDEA